ncbi:MAG: C40 family peptidase [Candidatus Thiodiazotropha sp. (ex Monitilora ramsayi)]|nr:C40 family peptidase [Candidatus Thiodiazotropha sp. (ex Monitilora ramsayi)]
MQTRNSQHKPVIRLILSNLILVFLAGCSSQPAVYTDTHAMSGHIPTSPAAAAKTRHPAVEIALAQLSKPYRYGGNSPAGFDCSGLVHFAFSRSGIPVPRTSLDQYRHSQPIGRERIQPGDLLFFQIAGKQPSHVGLYVGKGQFIHASTSEKKVTLSGLKNPYWRKRLIGAGRY